MKETLDRLIGAQRVYLDNRPIMRDDLNQSKAVSRIGTESHEALQATPEQLPEEIADVFLEWCNLVILSGVENIGEVILAKVAKNRERFPREQFQEGDFREKYDLIKRKELQEKTDAQKEQAVRDFLISYGPY